MVQGRTDARYKVLLRKKKGSVMNKDDINLDVIDIPQMVAALGLSESTIKFAFDGPRYNTEKRSIAEIKTPGRAKKLFKRAKSYERKKFILEQWIHTCAWLEQIKDLYDTANAFINGEGEINLLGKLDEKHKTLFYLKLKAHPATLESKIAMSSCWIDRCMHPELRMDYWKMLMMLSESYDDTMACFAHMEKLQGGFTIENMFLSRAVRTATAEQASQLIRKMGTDKFDPTNPICAMAVLKAAACFRKQITLHVFSKQ